MINRTLSATLFLFLASFATAETRLTGLPRDWSNGVRGKLTGLSQLDKTITVKPATGEPIKIHASKLTKAERKYITQKWKAHLQKIAKAKELAREKQLYRQIRKEAAMGASRSTAEVLSLTAPIGTEGYLTNELQWLKVVQIVSSKKAIVKRYRQGGRWSDSFILYANTHGLVDGNTFQIKGNARMKTPESYITVLGARRTCRVFEEL